MAYKEIPKQNKGMIQTFRGLNAHERVGDGEWTDMLNLSADEYPVEMTRKHRTVASNVEIKVVNTVVTGDYVETIITNESINAAGVVRLRAYPSRKELEVRVASSYHDTNWQYLLTEYAPKAFFDEDVYVVDTSVIATLTDWPTDAITLENGIYVSNNGIIKSLNYGTNISGEAGSGSAGYRKMVGFNRKLFTNAGVIADATLMQRETVYCEIAMGSLESSLEPTVELVNGDGVINYTDVKPQTPTHGEYYYDSVTQGLYVYNDIDEDWHAVTTCWTRITLNAAQVQSKGAEIKAALERLHAGDLLQVGGIYHNGSDYGMLDTAMSVISTEPNSYRITLNGLIYCEHMDYFAAIRRMPKLDWICVHENRIFGCRFGEDDQGEFVNEVYACAPGDPYNWYRFEGLETDSWVSGVGAPGPWTGCCECGEYVFFFKEDIIYVLSGNGPSSFRLTPFNDFGVQEFSENSLAVMGNQAYYKSVHGIRRITPYEHSTKISAALGEDRWTGAYGGTDGQKYYVSMGREEDGEYVRRVYVFDRTTGIWTAENEPFGYIAGFVRYEQNLLAVGAEQSGATYNVVLKYMNAEHAAANVVTYYEYNSSTHVWREMDKRIALEDDGAFDWFGETGPMGLEEPNEKRIKSIQIRLKADTGTALRVQVQYDESGEWNEIAREIRGKRGTFRISYTPQRRCDTFRLRFEGKGDCIIYSIAIHAEDAGDSVG